MKLSKFLLTSNILIISFFFITACERSQEPQPPPSPLPQETTATPTQSQVAEEETVRAFAELHPTQNSQAFGKVEFTQQTDGVRIVAEMEGLTPGKHGFHVHEFGDCSAPDATSAGGHFAPHGTSHGGPDAPPDQRHAGDFGNIEAGPDGRARYERVDTVVRLTGPDSIIGRSVVVHADEDDMTSQPTGESGDRIACGVIQQVTQQWKEEP